MPRWRRRRDEEPEGRDPEAFEEFPEGEPFEESPEGALDEPSYDEDVDAGPEEWPEWAYDERRSRPRSHRRKRRVRFRRERERAPEADERPFDVEEIGGQAAPAEEEATDVDPRAAHDGSPIDEHEADDHEADDRWDDGDAYDAEGDDRATDADLYDDEEVPDERDDEEPSYRPILGDVVAGEVGPRRAALHERKRKQRRTAWVGGAVLLLALLFGINILAGDNDDEPEGPGGGTSAGTDARDDSVETMLLYGTRESDPAEGAAWLTLLSIDRERNRGSVVYIPAHTAVEVPGRGLLPLGEAVAGEDVPLLLVTTEGLLGIKIDRYLELSDKDMRVLFSDIGPLEVDVPSEVSVPAGSGQTQLIFPEGAQEVTGDQIDELLFEIGVDGDDVELGSRHLAFWDALFDSYGSRTEELEETILSAGSVLEESDRSAEENADLIGDLAGLPEDSMVLNSLPVQQVGVGAEGELYSTDEAEIERFVQDTIGARSFVGSETRIQILNGNGVPGIGDDVAELLVGEGYRVILSGNARHLDYEETLIITYERTEEAIALAEQAKELLGVGEVQVSGQEQGIVDLTIVVGKDFLGRT